MIKNKQVKFNLEKPEDKIIYWVDNPIIEEMKPFSYFSQARRFLEAKNRRNNGYGMFWETWYMLVTMKIMVLQKKN